jgi:hypothetical protein
LLLFQKQQQLMARKEIWPLSWPRFPGLSQRHQHDQAVAVLKWPAWGL